jgi:hypothetical protein
MTLCPCGNPIDVKMTSSANPDYSFGSCINCTSDPDFVNCIQSPLEENN